MGTIKIVLWCVYLYVWNAHEQPREIVAGFAYMFVYFHRVACVVNTHHLCDKGLICVHQYVSMFCMYMWHKHAKYSLWPGLDYIWWLCSLNYILMTSSFIHPRVTFVHFHMSYVLSAFNCTLGTFLCMFALPPHMCFF